MNWIWTAMIAVSVLFALFQGGGGARAVTDGFVSAAEQAVTFTFGLVGILAFWSGMMRLAQEAGITRAIGRLLEPLVRWLFPSIPKGHPATVSIVMALSANILGLGNAATPLGLRAMSDLASLAPGSRVATDAMCTFLALTTSSLTLIPGTVIAIRSAAGSADPAAIVGTTLVATCASTVVAVALDRLISGARRRKEGLRK